VFLSFLLIDERERRERDAFSGVGVKSGSRGLTSLVAQHFTLAGASIETPSQLAAHNARNKFLSAARCECVTLGVTDSDADERAPRGTERKENSISQRQPAAII